MKNDVLVNLNEEETNIVSGGFAFVIPLIPFVAGGLQAFLYSTAVLTGAALLQQKLNNRKEDDHRPPVQPIKPPEDLLHPHETHEKKDKKNKS